METLAKKSLRFTTFQLISFSVLLTIAYLSCFFFIWYKEGPVTLSLYNNLDESVYLSIPYFKANYLGIEGFYLEEKIEKPIAAVLSSYPSNVLDILVGTLASNIGLHPTELGLLLDFFCFPIVFLLAYRLFKILGFSDLTSIFCSYVYLAHPWIFSPNRAAGYLPTFSSFFASSDIQTEDVVSYGMPAFRGLYTQVSIIGFLLLVNTLAKYIIKSDKKDLYIAGFYSSLCFYLYIFSGISAFVLSIVTIGIFSFTTIQKPIFWLNIGRFGLGFLPLGAIAIIWMIVGETGSIPRHPELRNYWYLPTEFIVYILAILILLKKEIHQQAKSILKVILILLLAELITMNIQPILGRVVISPYHFPEFFFHPIFSTLTVARILDWIEKRFFITMLVRLIFICFFAAIICVDVIRSSNAVLQLHRMLEPKNELARYLKENTSEDTVFAMNTFRKPFVKNYENPLFISAVAITVAAVSQRPLLFNNWSPASFNVDGVNRIQREFLLGWILSGEWQLLWKSPENIDLPGDLFSLVSAQTQLFRRYEQRRLKSESGMTVVCKAFRENKVDLVIEDKTYNLSNEKIKKYLNLRWKSQDDSYKVYNFNQELFIQECCDVNS